MSKTADGGPQRGGSVLLLASTLRAVGQSDGATTPLIADEADIVAQ